MTNSRFLTASAAVCFSVLAGCRQDTVTSPTPTDTQPTLGGPAASAISVATGSGPLASQVLSKGPTFSESTGDGPVPARRSLGANPSASASAAGATSYVLWQNRQAGVTGFWSMNGTSYLNDWIPLGTTSREWMIGGVADFTGDKLADLVWENTRTGEVGIYVMDGTTFRQWFPVAFVQPEWEIAAAADLNADGQPDIIWQNKVTGERGYWPMKGGRMTGQWVRLYNQNLAPEWQIVAAADMTQDGYIDLVWQNTRTGERGFWPLTKGVWNGQWISIPPNPTDWDMAAAYDLNADGSNDLLWHNSPTGQTGIWIMSGPTWTRTYVTLPNSAAGWTVAGVVPFVARTESEMFLSAARIAWTFIENNTQPATGLAKAHDGFQFITQWDIASQIGGTYSAHELEIIDDATYDSRIKKILSTLQSMPLFDGAAFNRFYDSQTGKMVSRSFQPSTTGFGWSATDIGRLLTWLKILAVNQPQYASQARTIVNRLNMSRIIGWGKLQGVEVDATGRWSQFDEVGLGYEQYAAAGFQLWGARASESISPTWHAQATKVLGVTVWIDDRGTARLTSEPYIMMGLETGFWASALNDQAKGVLAAQQARYDQQHMLTMVTEDAMPDGPDYFYYYSVYNRGQTFVVDAPGGKVVQNPRWVSTKAAFSWRAIFPTDYTWRVFNAVQAAAIYGDGWGAGIYEGSLAPTGYATLNTAGMVLESALRSKLGHSFISEPIS
jgi:hypothetical protein